MVMPGKGKSYTAFQRDDDYCQSSAQAAVGYRSPGQASNDQTVGGAAVGTAVGALAGAAIGAAAGNAGTGALVGAGAGLAGGSIVGAGNGRRAGGASYASASRSASPRLGSFTGSAVSRPAIPTSTSCSTRAMP